MNLKECREPLTDLLKMSPGSDKLNKADEMFDLLSSVNLMDGSQISEEDLINVIGVLSDLENAEWVKKVISRVSSENYNYINLDSFLKILSILDGSADNEQSRKRDKSYNLKNKLSIKKSITLYKQRNRRNSKMSTL